jgi:aspartyl-tRNA(Asn)/glutamyl-tRNA(Gln) amidotransferase subunit A
MEDLLNLDLVEAARRVASREVSPVDLVSASIQKIDRENERLRAFVTILADSAMVAAREAEHQIVDGTYRGILHGIPVAVKDLFAIDGVPMTAGSAVLEGFIAERDAPVIKQLKDLGAVIVGTTALDEFAFATVGNGILNPADEGRSPGGSSGGSAVAVASRLCFGALGTDTGGSVRIPASCCGVVGLKPTIGSIPTVGVVPLAWSLDHIGALARSVRDAAAMLGPLTGSGTNVKPREDLANLRVGVPTNHYLRVADGHLRQRFDHAMKALSALGARTTEVDIPDSDVGLNLQYLTVLPESAAYHFGRHADGLSRYGKGVRAALQWGATVSATEYLDAQRVRGTMAARVTRLLSEVHVLALPTMPIAPPVIGQEEVVLEDGRREDVVSAMLRFTCLFNHTGHPAISIPVGSLGDSPFGLQLIGGYLSDRSLLEIASACEAVLS